MECGKNQYGSQQETGQVTVMMDETVFSQKLFQTMKECEAVSTEHDYLGSTSQTLFKCVEEKKIFSLRSQPASLKLSITCFYFQPSDNRDQ